MDIDQHLLFVGSSFLLSNFLCDKFRRSYSGLKYFFALIFPIFAAFSQFSSLYILRYSHKLPIGLLCMEIVLYRCQLAIELRNGVFIWILGHFLRANIWCIDLLYSKNEGWGMLGGSGVEVLIYDFQI